MTRTRLFLLFVIIIVLSSSINAIPVVHAQDTLSSADIERISKAVVLIVVLDDRDKALGTGSGTLISKNGLILTNRHVVEDGADFAIMLLEDINERPVATYRASVVFVSDEPDLDFATLQIDRNDNGAKVDPNKLNLPFLNLSKSDVQRGDPIYLFGYPGLGDGYLVISPGVITTVQNGTINGKRIHVWYQTDAEIAPGNSGGVAVNNAGDLIGIPTSVVTEKQTGGRLGGILPFAAILAAGDVMTMKGNQTDITTDGLSATVQKIDTSAQKLDVYVKVQTNGERGSIAVVAFFFWDNDKPISGRVADNKYKGPDGDLIIYSVYRFSNGNDQQTVRLSIPLDQFPRVPSGVEQGYVKVAVGLDGQDLSKPSKPRAFNADLVR